MNKSLVVHRRHTYLIGAAIAVIGAASLPPPAAGLPSFIQQGDKLVAEAGATSGADQGSSVAVSADGNTIIVGGSGNNNNVGAVWVFFRSNAQGTWTMERTAQGEPNLAATDAVGASAPLSR